MREVVVEKLRRLHEELEAARDAWAAAQAQRGGRPALTSNSTTSSYNDTAMVTAQSQVLALAPHSSTRRRDPRPATGPRVTARPPLPPVCPPSLPAALESLRAPFRAGVIACVRLWCLVRVSCACVLCGGQTSEEEEEEMDLSPMLRAALDKLWQRPYDCRVFVLQLLQSMAALDDGSLCMMASCFARYLDSHAVPA